MTDLTKLSVDELLDSIGRAGAYYGFDPSRIAAELRRRFAALNARITELEIDANPERLALLEETFTQANDGDSIWKFYDAKLWRSLIAWKDRALTAEAEWDALKEALRKIRSHPSGTIASRNRIIDAALSAPVAEEEGT